MPRFLLLSLVLLSLAAAADPATNASASRIADPDAVETALESYRQDAAGRLRISLRSSVVPAVARAFLGARKRNDGTEAPVCCLFVSVRTDDSFPIGEELPVETNGVIRYAVDLDKLNKAIETLSDNERPDPKDRVLHLFVNDMETEVGRWDLAAGADPATNAPAAESVLYVEVPDDGVHAPEDFERRFLHPLRRRLRPFARGAREPAPEALRDWTAEANWGAGAHCYVIGDRFAAPTNAPAALAALRALAAEMAPALPPGVEPVVELRERRIARPPHGVPPEIEGEARPGDPRPASADEPPRFARAGVCATYLSDLPPRELFPFLEREALPAARRALAAAFPGRARPVPVAVHGDTAGSGLLSGPRGGAVVAGPLALAETEAAAAALAAALAPAALPPPDGVRAPRIARLAVPADEDGNPLPPGAYGFLAGISRAFDAAQDEDRAVWLPDGAAPPGGGAWLLLAAPVDGRVPRPDADEFALAPLARLAARAGWCAPGAEPVRAFVLRTGGVVLVPLAPDAPRDEAAAARAQARAAALEESFPDGVGAVRATIRELPAGDPAATLAAVRDALFDAASLDEHLFFGEGFLSGGEAWSRRAVLAAEAREAARAAAPPGLAEAFPPFADRLLAALRECDGAAFATLFDDATGASAPADPAAAPATAALVTHPFLAPFAAAAATNAPPETVARPLDADARAALLALLPGLAPRIDRAFLVVLRIPPESETPGRPGAEPGTLAVLPCVLADGGPRLLPAPTWTFRRSQAPAGVPGWRNVLAELDAPPALRNPATDAFASALLRLARAAATNEDAALRAAEALVPPAELAAAAAAPSALRILVRELAAAVAEGPVELRFEPVTLDARGPGHLLDRFERSPHGLALDDGRGGVVRPFTDPDPPLAARIPGAWLRVLVCAPDPDGGDGAAPLASLFAILGDGGLRLHLPPVDHGHAHAAGHECPPSAYRSFARRRRAEAFGATSIRAFKRPFRAAAAQLGPGRLATVSFAFAPGPIPADFRREWGLPEDDRDPDASDESPEDVLDRLFHRDADRVEFVARSGLASDLNAADPCLLVDLAPGEKVRYLAATDADGTTATIEFGNPPRDPDSPRALDGGARLKYDWMTRRRDGGGGGSFGDIDLSRASFDLRGAAGRASRTVSKEDLVGRSSRTASVKDPRGPPDLAFVWTPTNAGPVLVRVAWARGTDPDANAALVEAFLADPENPAASDDLRIFQLRLPRPER